MKNVRFVGIVGGVLFGAGVLAQSAQALPPYPDRATVYQVKFARAMDECASGFVTVVSGINGCPQANTGTDQGVATFGQANLKVSHRGASRGAFIRFSGKGFTGSDKVGIRMTLRITNTLGAPAGSKTFEDVSVYCGDIPGSACGNYIYSGSGRPKLRQALDDCLTLNGLNAMRFGAENIEVIDSALINCNNGKVAGTPGILQE